MGLSVASYGLFKSSMLLFAQVDYVLIYPRGASFIGYSSFRDVEVETFHYFPFKMVPFIFDAFPLIEAYLPDISLQLVHVSSLEVKDTLWYCHGFMSLDINGEF